MIKTYNCFDFAFLNNNKTFHPRLSRAARIGWLVGWLVGCFGFNGPLRQYFSLYRAVSQRGRKRRERIDESKNVQTTPTRTYCKCSRPLPYCNPNCRTPRHWKFTQHHRTTRPPPVGWLVLGFNSPLRQYFSLYRAVSQREGERGERIDESKNVQTTPTRTYCKRNRPLPYEQHENLIFMLI